MRRWCVLVLAAIAAWSWPIAVSGQELQITEVTVEGLVRVNREFVLTRIATRPGSIWNPATAARDLQRLYRTDRFRRVNVDSERTDTGVKVIFRVVEAPFVINIRFEGLQGLDREDMLSGMNDAGIDQLPKPFNKPEAYWGQPLSDGRLADMKAAIQRAAVADNFSDLTVSHRLDTRDEGVDLVFVIEEAHEVIVDDFKISTDGGYSQRYIENSTRLNIKEEIFIFSDGIFDPAMLRDDILQIQSMFRERGHLDVTVDATVTRVANPPGFWGRMFNSVTEDEVSVRLHVREGPLYSLGTIRVTGTTIVFSKTQILEAFGLKSGDIADTKAVREGRERVEELYGNKGYVPEGQFPDPVLTQFRIHHRADERTRTVDLEIAIREGQPIVIRDLVVRGNERTRDEVIRRELLLLAPGETYNWANRKEALRRLKDLGYFENRAGIQLHVDPRIGRTERNLILDVEETQTGNFNVGMTVNSEGDLTANLGIGQSNFDATDITGFPFNAADFFRNRQYVGKGQEFNLRLNPGTRTSNYSVSLFEPWFLARPYGVGISGSFNTTDFRDWDEERLSFAQTVSRRWYLGAQKLLTIGVRYRQEDISFVDVEPDAPSLILNIDRDIRIRGLAPFFTYDTRDNKRNPSEGYFHELHFERAGGFLGGIDFSRVSQRSAYYFTLYENREEERQVLAVTSKLDWIQPFGNSGQIPISERYFLGGMRTLRGYAPSDIGAKEVDTPLGGTTRHYGSVEYSIPIAGETLKAVTFIDYGALQFFEGTTFSEWTNNYRFGAGIGLRLIVPQVNFPLSLDFAEPIGPKSHGDERRSINFSFSSRTAF